MGCFSRTITATTSTKEKIDWLLGLHNGPTHAANYKTEDFSAVVKQVTNNKGANVVIDVVGQSHFNKNIDSLAVDGRMTMLAVLSGMSITWTLLRPLISVSGAVADAVNLAPIIYKRLHIEGSTLRSRSLEYQANLIERYRFELFFLINFTPWLSLLGLNRRSFRRSQAKTVPVPLGRIFIRKVMTRFYLTLFSWPSTVFYYPGVLLDGNKVCASRNGREQEQESDLLTENDLQLIYMSITAAKLSLR